MEIVLHILCNAYGNPEGNGNYRVWADHSKLEIEFCDVSTSKLTGNIISQNMLSQVDSEGRHVQLLKEICDNSSD